MKRMADNMFTTIRIHPELFFPLIKRCCPLPLQLTLHGWMRVQRCCFPSTTTPARFIHCILISRFLVYFIRTHGSAGRSIRQGGESHRVENIGPIKSIPPKQHKSNWATKASEHDYSSCSCKLIHHFHAADNKFYLKNKKKI